MPGRNNHSDLESPKMQPGGETGRLWQSEPQVLWSIDTTKGNSGPFDDARFESRGIGSTVFYHYRLQIFPILSAVPFVLDRSVM